MLSLTRACVCFSFSHGGSSVQKRRQESRSRYLAYRGESSRKRSDCKLQLLELDIIRRLRPSVCEDHRSLGTKPHWPHPLGFIMAAAAVMASRMLGGVLFMLLLCVLRLCSLFRGISKRLCKAACYCFANKTFPNCVQRCLLELVAFVVSGVISVNHNQLHDLCALCVVGLHKPKDAIRQSFAPSVRVGDGVHSWRIMLKT